MQRWHVVNPVLLPCLLTGTYDLGHRGRYVRKGATS